MFGRRSRKATRDMFGRRIPGNMRITFRRDVLAEALWQYGAYLAGLRGGDPLSQTAAEEGLDIYD